MINNLTPEQEAKMPEYVDFWTKIGTTTGPCDRKKCMKYAKEAHILAGLPKINKFYFTRSPIEAIDVIQKIFADQNLTIERKQIINDMMMGYNETWLSFYQYMQDVVGVTLTESINPLIKMAEVCGWWSSYSNDNDSYVIFQDRPDVINMQNGVLHCDNGPSIKFSDGFCVWSLEGHRVTEQIVLRPETLTIDQIHRELNQDIVSIMINRFGWVRYLEEISAKCLHKCHNPVENTIEALYTTEMFGKRFVATCPTGRVFVMGVPDNVENCDQAQQWLGNDVDRKCNVIGRT